MAQINKLGIQIDGASFLVTIMPVLEAGPGTKAPPLRKINDIKEEDVIIEARYILDTDDGLIDRSKRLSLAGTNRRDAHKLLKVLCCLLETEEGLP